MTVNKKATLALGNDSRTQSISLLHLDRTRIAVGFARDASELERETVQIIIWAGGAQTGSVSSSSGQSAGLQTFAVRTAREWFEDDDLA